tara:strand:+ start:58 stop:591 length:534 start_codon:yes stop_codon:yes gene_type:complete
MNYALILFLVMNTFQTSSLIFKFEPGVSTKGWRVIDDRVMGGRSQGDFEVNLEGLGVFEGYVTTENNGGFSSLRYSFYGLKTTGFTSVVLKLKGDGKSYQFRLKESDNQRHSYIYSFTTSGEVQEITIPLKNFVPSFRGYTLDIPNFNANKIEEIAFLIGNKVKENFRLEIDRISLK